MSGARSLSLSSKMSDRSSSKTAVSIIPHSSSRTRHLKAAVWDYKLKAVYTIGILNFSFPDLRDGRYMREVQLIDRETHEIFYDKLTFIYLEMPNFRKEESELESHFDKWMYVLKNLSRLQDRPPALQERVFERLFSAAEIARLNPTEMKAYDESLKVLWDNYSIVETAKQEGIEEGMEKGR